MGCKYLVYSGTLKERTKSAEKLEKFRNKILPSLDIDRFFLKMKEPNGETILWKPLEEKENKALNDLSKLVPSDAGKVHLDIIYEDRISYGIFTNVCMLPKKGIFLNCDFIQYTINHSLSEIPDPRQAHSTRRFAIKSKALNGILASINKLLAKPLAKIVDAPIGALSKLLEPASKYPPGAIIFGFLTVSLGAAAISFPLKSLFGIDTANAIWNAGSSIAKFVFNPAVLAIAGIYATAKLYALYVGERAEAMLADFEPIKENLEILLKK